MQIYPFSAEQSKILNLSLDEWQSFRDDIQAFGWLHDYSILERPTSQTIAVKILYPTAFNSEVELLLMKTGRYYD